MTDEPVVDEKRMRLRFAGICSICGRSLPARGEAIYERTSKTVRCLTHEASTDVDSGADHSDVGTPGASARREFERRKARREQRLRKKHPKIGGLLHAISDEPQSTAAWYTGAIGEEQLGGRLNELGSDRLLVLHDRRIPGSRANIDHLAVTPTGVFVIDAKKYAGRPSLRVRGGLLRPRSEKLLVGTRDCTKLVDGMLKQVGVVVDAIGDAIHVNGVLCFVEADWPLLGGAFTTRGVSVLRPKKLYPQLQADGRMTAEAISHIHRLIAIARPSA